MVGLGDEPPKGAQPVVLPVSKPGFVTRFWAWADTVNTASSADDRSPAVYLFKNFSMKFKNKQFTTADSLSGKGFQAQNDGTAISGFESSVSQLILDVFAGSSSVFVLNHESARWRGEVAGRICFRNFT